MKRITHSLLLFILFTCTVAVHAQIEVLSFNVRVDVDGGNKAWNARKQACYNVVHQVYPDFMGIQEALPHQTNDMDGALADYYQFGRGREANGGGEGSQIFYRHANWELLSENGTFQLSPTPDVPGSNGWGFGYLRICTFGRFRNKQTGQYIYVYNTHYPLDGNGRTNCSNLIADRIAHRTHPEDPVILMGDFNADEGEYSMLIFKGASGSPVNMVEAWREVNPHESNKGTFSGWNHTPNGGAKIDHIFSLGHTGISEANYIFPNPGEVVSDHFPVRAVINYGPVITPPSISNITHTPDYPNSTDPITVACQISDDGSISSATLHWGVESGQLNQTVHLSSTGAHYFGDIPVQADKTFIYYRITAVDNDGQTATSTEYVFQVQDNPQRLFADFDHIDLTFEGFGGSSFDEIDNPHPNTANSSNRVGSTTQGVETWAGIYSNNVTPSIDFVHTPRFTMKVWAPKAGDLLIKFEDESNTSHFYEQLVTITETNTWTEIAVDFSMAPSGEFEKVVLFFDFDQGAQDTYYFDDIMLSQAPITHTHKHQHERKLSAYPNPVHDALTITSTTTDGTITVLDAIGNAFLDELHAPATISCSDWPAGVYTIIERSAQQSQRISFIKP